VRSLGAYTAQLDELVQWFKDCGIKTVAMESTGVYWIPLYQKLEEAGFEVLLVDARQAKHVPGRKSDVQDCRWLQQLHSYGLLRAAFRPEDSICRLRTLQRHRKNMVEYAAMWIQHIQKALNEMNLHLHHVLSDISGQSGLGTCFAEKGYIQTIPYSEFEQILNEGTNAVVCRSARREKYQVFR